MLKEAIWNLLYENDLPFVLSKIDVDERLKEAEEDIILQQETILGLEATTDALQNDIDAFLDTKNKEKELEVLWNNKRPKTNWRYSGRTLLGSNTLIRLDPRIFYQTDYTLPRVSGTNDEKALNALDHVKYNIKYTPDEGEFWQFAYETKKRKKGDCEDGSILMANIMINSGIPWWRVRLNAGNVQGGGHAYVTYLRESDNQWYVMDWCFFYTESKNFGKLWKKAQKYFGIWGSWNTKYIFGDLPKEGI